MAQKQWLVNGVEFKAGDRVRVMRQIETNDENGMGDGVEWENNWVDEMDKYLGLEFEILDISPEGADISKTCFYLFPLAALDKV
jgi:hypothetical protein